MTDQANETLLCENCGIREATHTATDEDRSVGYYRTLELCDRCDPDPAD